MGKEDQLSPPSPYFPIGGIPEIFEKALWPESPEMATILENYAALLQETNREDEAAKIEDRAKAIGDRQSKQNSK